VSEQLIAFNRSREKLSPQGLVIHATATPGATAQDEFAYFNSGDRQASAHYFVDWRQIIRTVPEDEVAWHAGRTANHKYLAVEMCEPAGNDAGKFDEVWQRTVWLVADACVRYGWSTGPNVWSHRGIANLYGETDHTDPIDYLSRYGKTWEQLLAAIAAEINRLQQGADRVEHAVLFFGPDDYVAARRIAERYGNCAMYQRKPDGTFNADVLKANHLIVVGGPQVAHPNVTWLSGSDWFGTMAAVGKFLG